MGFIHSFGSGFGGACEWDTISVIVISLPYAFLQRDDGGEESAPWPSAPYPASSTARRVKPLWPPLHRPAAFSSCRRLHRRRYGEESSCGDYLTKMSRPSSPVISATFRKAVCPPIPPLSLAVSLSGVALNGFLLSMVPLVALDRAGLSCSTCVGFPRIPAPRPELGPEWRNLVASL